MYLIQIYKSLKSIVFSFKLTLKFKHFNLMMKLIIHFSSHSNLNLISHIWHFNSLNSQKTSE